MTLVELAQKLRPIIEEAMSGVDDEKALDAVTLFPKWNESGTAYEAGNRVRHDGVLYKCIQSHTSQESWNPVDAVSLWAKVLIPNPDVTPEWEQPNSTNPYMMGDKVTHNGKTWQSVIDNNVWEPGVVGTESLWVIIAA